MNRIYKILNAAIPYFAAEVLQYFLLLVILYLQKLIIIPGDMVYLLSAGIIVISGLVFFFWYSYEIKGEKRGSIRKLLTVKYLSLFIFMSIGCQFFFSGAMSLIRPFFTKVFTEYSDVLDNLTSGNEIIVLLFMILIAPISEELIFRGVILYRANKYMGFIYANILQAIFFGVYHGNAVQGTYAALIGFLLGAAYYKFQTIYAPILLHMLINASSLLMMFVPDELISYIIITLFGGGLMLLSIFGIDFRKGVGFKQ